MYTALFLFDTYIRPTGKEYLRDYSWWIELVSKIAPKADKFEIRCWPGETEAIATGMRFGEQIENNQTNELVFKGQISEAFLKHIYEDGFDRDGALKWFTLNFYKGKEDLFHFGHYGTEPVIQLKTEEEVSKLKEWSRKYTVITRVDVFEAQGS